MLIKVYHPIFLLLLLHILILFFLLLLFDQDSLNFYLNSKCDDHEAYKGGTKSNALNNFIKYLLQTHWSIFFSIFPGAMATALML